jgi:hypothetical protein
MKVVLVQESWVDWPDVTYDRVGNILLSRLMGADVRLVNAGFGIGFKESWEQALARSSRPMASLTPSPPGRPIIRSAALASRRGRARSKRRRPSSASSSTRSSSARSPVRPRPA